MDTEKPTSEYKGPIPDWFIPGEYAQIRLDTNGGINVNIFRSGHGGIFTKKAGFIYPFENVKGLIDDIMGDPQSGYPRDAKYEVLPLGYIDEKLLRSLGPVFFKSNNK
jgi:hypothetical protein